MIEEVLKKFSDFKITPLINGASKRKYFRILNNNHNSKILAIYPNELQESLKRYVFWTKELKAKGFNVPEIYKEENNYLILEDLGDVNFQSFYNTNSKSFSNFMLIAMKNIVLLQSLNYNDYLSVISQKDDAETAFEKRINLLIRSLDDREIGDFILGNIQNINGYIDFYKSHSKKLFKSKMVLAISDYQSRNLHIFNKKLYVIDFQDIILAPDVLDLSALLYDPYAGYNPNKIDYYLNLYIKNFNNNLDIDNFYIISVYKLLNAIRVYCDMIYKKNRLFYKAPLKMNFEMLNSLKFLLK